MIHIETERLLIRNVTPVDADAMYDYRNQEQCVRYQRGQQRGRREIEALLLRCGSDSLSANAPALMAVTLKSTGEMIGEISVMPSNHTFSLGCTISSRHHQNGYAFEALAALLSLLHAQFPDQELLCFVDPENLPSMALLGKLGLRDMGYVPSKNSCVFGKWLTPQTEEEIAQAINPNRG